MSKPQIVNDVIKFLESKGHTCIMYFINKNKLEWCHQDVCVRQKQLEEMKKRDKDNMKFASELKEKGHNCISILESYPAQIIWCQQEVCSGYMKH